MTGHSMNQCRDRPLLRASRVYPTCGALRCATRAGPSCGAIHPFSQNLAKKDGSNLFWLSDEQWKRIEPHLPTDVRGIERANDRRVISGIVHVLKSGCRWCDCPPEYGPPTTIYNRFVRWARRGIWENLFRELARNGRSTDTQMIDSTHVKAHRSAAGGKGGRGSRLLAARAVGATRRSMHLQMLKGASSPSC